MIYIFTLMFLFSDGRMSLIEVTAAPPITVQTATALTCEMANGLPKVCALK
jgi:hypothetical protein